MYQQEKSVKQKDKIFSFYEEDAIKYGVSEAIFLFNIRYWVEHNKANGINYQDGRYWSYNSRKSYSKIFQFFSEDQIKRIVKNLVEAGILLKGRFNAKNYDLTNWYSINESWAEHYVGYDGEPKNHILPEKNPNGLGENTQGRPGEIAQTLGGNAQPIPDINNKYKQEQNINKGGEAFSGPAPAQVFSLFNEIVKDTGIPKVEKITEKRRDACNRLTKKHFKTIGEWSYYFSLIAESRFLCGDNDRSWTADIDFALTESKVVKILEGVYRNKVKTNVMSKHNTEFLRSMGVEI